MTQLETKLWVRAKNKYKIYYKPDVANNIPKDCPLQKRFKELAQADYVRKMLNYINKRNERQAVYSAN